MPGSRDKLRIDAIWAHGELLPSRECHYTVIPEEWQDPVLKGRYLLR